MDFSCVKNLTSGIIGRSFKRICTMPSSAAEETVDTLIVDDDESCRALLDKFLRVRGHVPACAASIAEARPMIGADCKRVILDLNLPDGQGTELLRHIRDENLPIKVAITTGVSDRVLLAEV